MWIHLEFYLFVEISWESEVNQKMEMDQMGLSPHLEGNNPTKKPTMAQMSL